MDHFLFPPLTGYCPQTKHPLDLFHPQFFSFFFSSCPDFYISSLDPALRPRNRPKTEIHELCIAVCACVCVHSSVEHRRHNAVLLFAITQGCFLLYLTIFHGDIFFSLNIWTTIWLCFEEHSATLFCLLQNIIAPALCNTFTVHDGEKKKQISLIWLPPLHFNRDNDHVMIGIHTYTLNTHKDVLLQPRVHVLVWSCLQRLDASR